jgi:hypothetical protein
LINAQISWEDPSNEEIKMVDKYMEKCSYLYSW